MKRNFIIIMFMFELFSPKVLFSKNTLNMNTILPNKNNCYCIKHFDTKQLKDIRIDGKKENDENYLFCYNKKIDIHIATNGCFGVKNSDLSSLPKNCVFTINDACGYNGENSYISYSYECNYLGCKKIETQVDIDDGEE